MADPVLRISPDDQADRFSRFELIGWWDQNRLRNARVIVVGAGALGNELLKNLALLGIGHVTVIDMDRIEHSNLSRSVLYRAKDAGRFKAEVAAEAARDLFPDMRVTPVVGDVRLDLGLGDFRDADVVLGGLDNREARLAINRACYRVGTPWIDGAIERIDGVARVFVPPGPCYECTMSKADWDVLRHRRSCAGLSRKEMEGGKTPTTPTVSSIIAGVQVQEAVKLLHDLPTIAGRGWTFSGEAAEGWQVEYQRKDDCLSHDPLVDIVAVPENATFGDLLREARTCGAGDLELPKTLLDRFECPACDKSEDVGDLLERVSADCLTCPHCRAPRRPVTLDRLSDTSLRLDQIPADCGFPANEIFLARTAAGPVGLAMNAGGDVGDLGLELT